MFRNMEYIYAVYKAEGFSAAAQKLYVSQPCLSAMVKKTEDRLGVPIFDRKTKPLCLTEYGERYIAYIEKLQALEWDFEQSISDLQGLRTGNLCIGASNAMASYILPGLIHNFKEKYPGVQVQMTEGNIAHLENALMQGTVDFVLDNCPMSPECFQQHQIGTEHLLLAVHKSLCEQAGVAQTGFTWEDVLAKRHLLADAPAVSIENFAKTPFILLRAGNDTRYRIDALFRMAQVRPDVQLEVDQLTTAYNIACNKLGAALVSDTLICNGSPDPEMCFYKLDEEMSARPIYLYHKRTRYVTLAMQKFLEIAAEEK